MVTLGCNYSYKIPTLTNHIMLEHGWNVRRSSNLELWIKVMIQSICLALLHDNTLHNSFFVFKEGAHPLYL